MDTLLSISTPLDILEILATSFLFTPYTGDDWDEKTRYCQHGGFGFRRVRK